MINTKAIPAFFLLFSFVSPVLADDDSGVYLGAGIASTSVAVEGIDDIDESIYQLGLRGGYMFTNNIGIDFTGLLAADSSDNGLSVETGMLGISGILAVPLGENFDLYGKLGGARVNASASFAGFTLSDESSTELFWGLGGEVDLGMVNLFLEYNRFDTDLIDINSAMAGIKFEL